MNSEHEWVKREDWSVCSRCGVVRNRDRETVCSGKLPGIRQRQVGDKVRVCIQHPDHYATGSAECLDGKTGTVSQVRIVGNLPNHALVEFDTPAATWWSAQSPCKAFWFDLGELQDA